jgi:hypothetical protein
METDPASLDPELRAAKFTAIASAAFGILSLCMAIIPMCGGGVSLAGILLGWYTLRIDPSKTAIFGIAVSALGMLIAIVYALFLFFFQSA